jgi:hypothetical protein
MFLWKTSVNGVIPDDCLPTSRLSASQVYVIDRTSLKASDWNSPKWHNVHAKLDKIPSSYSIVTSHQYRQQIYQGQWLHQLS